MCGGPAHHDSALCPRPASGWAESAGACLRRGPGPPRGPSWKRVFAALCEDRLRLQGTQPVLNFHFFPPAHTWPLTRKEAACTGLQPRAKVELASTGAQGFLGGLTQTLRLVMAPGLLQDIRRGSDHIVFPVTIEVSDSGAHACTHACALTCLCTHTPLRPHTPVPSHPCALTRLCMPRRHAPTPPGGEKAQLQHGRPWPAAGTDDIRSACTSL